MREPRDLVEILERSPPAPRGDGERFVGYGVLGLTFDSGYVLGLRRWVSSSLGVPYASVWLRDPEKRWVFFQTAPPEAACSRYFGSAVTDASTAGLEIAWTGPRTVSVRIDGGDTLEWRLTLGSRRSSRALNRINAVTPQAVSAAPWGAAAVDALASHLLGTGRLGLSGRTPNGQAFRLQAEQWWLVAATTARYGGRDLGIPAALPTQARLGDLRIPQRGVFVIGRGWFEAFDPLRHRSATSRVPQSGLLREVVRSVDPSPRAAR